MGRYFDYTPPPSAADLSTGLSSVGDALTDVLNRRQRQREIDARLAMDRTQQAINQRKANEDTARFKRQQHLDALQGVNAIQQRLDKGDQGGAQAVAQAFDMQMEPGKPADVGPAPQAPVAPAPAQGMPPEIAARRRGRTLTSEEPGGYQSKGQPAGSYVGVDPLDPTSKPPASVTSREYDPETQGARYQATSDMIAEEAARADQARFDNEKPAYDAAAAAFPGQQRDYQMAQRRAEEERPYTLHMQPGDAGITVHGKSQQAAREEKAQQFLASFDGVQLSPEEKEAVKMGYGSVLAGEDPAKAMAAFRTQRMGVQNRAFKHGENQFHEGEADKRTAMMAQGQSAKDAYFLSRVQEGRAAGNRQDRGELRQEVGDWERNVADLRKDAGVWKRLRMSLSNINSDNPTGQQDAILGLASVFRGGNAATKDVTAAIRNHLGGAGARAEGWLEQAATGKLGPEQQRTALGAIQSAIKEHDGQIMEHIGSFDAQFGPGNGLEDQAAFLNGKRASILREHGLDAPPLYGDANPDTTRLGSTQRPYQGKPKKKPGPAAPPEVKAAGKAKDSSLDAAMQ